MPAYEVKHPLHRKHSGTKLTQRQQVVFAPTAGEAEQLAAQIDPSRDVVVNRLVGFGAVEHGCYSAAVR